MGQRQNFFRAFRVMVSMKIAGITLLIIGVASIIIQNTFYGYVDAEGVLHDSLFLPIGAFATILGISLLSAWGVTVLLRKARK
jgi:intracellular septation protein A